MAIRFHLDENVSSAIARALRRRGVDVTTTPEQHLIGASDEEQFAFAQSEQRVFVTHDTDFFTLIELESSHAGIAYCDKERRSLSHIVRTLLLMWEIMTSEDMQNHVEYI
ncbi:DUF5615 family PIN-like protein [Candidatus Entotheonella palauensis]|uniref:DUF5615 domain-containing protein n=1 Tax=Candidatus Entotheonella gemina TaxID=1429439 RepID=W4LLY4_9BACT|nr:DUF5615 family PIN-like protein [Candidatus Entotheonella palauensis]ETW99113.1 MAG: hypothetical protein ETSY2_41585 [Candidatus Entotheonella gemina]